MLKPYRKKFKRWSLH